MLNSNTQVLYIGHVETLNAELVHLNVINSQRSKIKKKCDFKKTQSCFIITFGFHYI